MIYRMVVQEYLKASGVPWTAVITCCFYDNFKTVFPFQRQPDSSRVWSDNLGTKPLPMHAVADIGETAAGVHADKIEYGHVEKHRVVYAAAFDIF